LHPYFAYYDENVSSDPFDGDPSDLLYAEYVVVSHHVFHDDDYASLAEV